MLAKVNSDYYGAFGLFHKETKSVELKTRESAPFEIDDALFNSLSKKGVLVRADAKETKKAEKAEAENKSIPAAEEKEPDTDEMEELESMSMDKLKEVGKEYGVTYKFGMSKKNMINEIRNAAEEELPIIEAAEPE